MNNIFDILADTLNHNSIIFLIIFVLSLVANLIQIYTFIQDRQKIKQEQKEKDKLIKLVETYEYILNLAKQNIKTEQELTAAEQEIQQRTNLIEEMENRKKALEKATQKQLVSQTLERNLSMLLQAHEDIVQLRAEYASLGDLPDIPENKRNEIEQEVNIAIKRPYEFPKSFVFKSILLVSFIFLLPYPVDTFLILIFLSVFLGTFFEAVVIYKVPDFTKWIIEKANLIGYLSTFGAWFAALGAARNFFYDPFDLVFQSLSERVFLLPTTNINLLLRTLLSSRWSTTETILLILSFIFAYFHWRIIRANVLSPIQIHLKEPQPTSPPDRV